MRKLALALALLIPASAQAADGPVGAKPLRAWQFRQAGGGGGAWRGVAVPYQWNAHDDSVASMLGGVGWFRRTVEGPVRLHFGAVSGQAQVSVDGDVVARHRGTFAPFDASVPAGRHRVVVRVDSRRTRSDFPPMATAGTLPGGGWWNASGILREVTAVPATGGPEIEALTVLPTLPCNACAAEVEIRAELNQGARPLDRRLAQGKAARGALNQGAWPLDLNGDVGGVPFHASGDGPVVTAHVTIDHPELWSPEHPHLYPVTATVGDSTWHDHTGIRRIDIRNGRLYLNGERLHIKGVGYHEETRKRGMAITDADRRRLITEAQAAGANLMRTHYPPGPALAAAADARGMLLWSEIPVYTMRRAVLARASVQNRAIALLRDNIITNGSHPSILAWSIGNELGTPVPPGQARYIRRAVAAAHALDPTRPVGLATKGYTTALCQRAYAPLDILGINEYFGWYYGSNASLSPFLDKAHRCYPHKALLVTEFGAEANRAGPATEKGTYAFQRNFVTAHLAAIARKPWLNGAIYWALREFRVRPGWSGGNPHPSPPLHKKGLLTWDGARKPAWYAFRRARVS